MDDQRFVRVDRVTAAGADLEVQVRAGDVAGRADVADQLAGADDVTGAHDVRRLVAEPQLGAVVEGDHGLVAVGAVVAGRGDHAVRDGMDRGAAGGGEVQAGVEVRPQAAVLAEAGGQVVALDGEDPLVQGDLLGLLLGLLGELGQGGVALPHLLLGLLHELLVRGVGQGVAARVAAHGGVTGVEEVAARGLAGAAEGARAGQPRVVRAHQARVRRGDGAAGGDGQCGDAEQDRRGGETAEQGAARAGAAGGGLGGPALPRGCYLSGHGLRGTTAVAATIRSVVAHKGVSAGSRG